MKGSLGTGILAMANAFNDSGYVIGCIGTVIIGVLCTYCIHQLITAEYELCKRKRVASLNYVGVTELALMEGPKFMQRFSKYAKSVVC
jgi:solute carrier family 36 (proton-coupled amino acid transporter)